MTLASSTGHESDMLVVCIFSHNAELRLCSTRSSRTLNKQKCELLLSPKSQRRRLWCQSPRLVLVLELGINHWWGIPRLVNASTHDDQKLRLMFSRKSSDFSRTVTLLTNQKVSKITHCGPCIAMALVSIKAPLLVSVHILAIILTILYVLQPFGS